MPECIKTIKVRVKDKHSRVLEAMARDVNFVWNYANELSYKHLKRTGKFFYCIRYTKVHGGSN